MNKTNFGDLAFFARHFNMDVNRLSWCIIEDRKKNYIRYLVGIRQDASKVVVSVEECCLRRLKRGKLAAHDAVLKQTKRGFRLRSVFPVKGQIQELIFTKRDLNNLYRDKWYDDSLG